MNDMPLQAKQNSNYQQWAARFAVAVACGGVAMAICVLPNLKRAQYLERWAGPLAGICFGTPIAAVAFVRWTVDQAADFNAGYNHARQEFLQGEQSVYQQQQYASNHQPAMANSPQQVAGNTFMASNSPELRSVSQAGFVPAASTMDSDDRSFLDALVD